MEILTRQTITPIVIIFFKDINIIKENKKQRSKEILIN